MEYVISLMGFVLVSTITPGPNNLLLAASGIRYGFRRTLPHVVGVQSGVCMLVALCGIGLGQILLSAPMAMIVLKVFGTAYLMYLAWKIIGFVPVDSTADYAAPMTVVQALIFQFSNPKAWMMATTGLNISLGITDSMLIAVLLLCGGFASLGVLCNFIWVMMGASLQRAFAVPLYRYWINGFLAAITVATVILLWLPLN
ncbi:MAG: threonine/homoserine/homoserine lactone efflux protein [Halieaceae bacterium]|jgi:threonine/homoserine/homoserine lactone efflux protein